MKKFPIKYKYKLAYKSHPKSISTFIVPVSAAYIPDFIFKCNKLGLIFRPHCCPTSSSAVVCFEVDLKKKKKSTITKLCLFHV